MQGEGRFHSDSLQQGARIHQDAVNARLFHPFSDSELPMKRMSVITPCHNSLPFISWSFIPGLFVLNLLQYALLNGMYNC